MAYCRRCVGDSDRGYAVPVLLDGIMLMHPLRQRSSHLSVEACSRAPARGKPLGQTVIYRGIIRCCLPHAAH